MAATSEAPLSPFIQLVSRLQVIRQDLRRVRDRPVRPYVVIVGISGNCATDQRQLRRGERVHRGVLENLAVPVCGFRTAKR